MEYTLVLWPESQLLMEQEWFQECFLAQPTSDEQSWVGSSAYFVPVERLAELSPVDYDYDQTH